MSKRFTLRFLDPILLMRWHNEPDAAATDELLTAIGAHFAETQTKLHYVGLVGVETPVPTIEGRKHLKRLMAEGATFIHCAHTVIEGDGAKSIMQRTVLHANFFLARTVLSQENYVHSTGQAAIEAVMREVNGSYDAMLTAAEATGLLAHAGRVDAVG